MAKKIVGFIKLQVPAGKANPSPPIGPDKSFTFIIKTPPATTLIKKAIKLDKGASINKNKVGKITRAQLEEIAKTKMKDMTAADVDAAVRTIAGSARSMGVIVEGV